MYAFKFILLKKENKYSILNADHLITRNMLEGEHQEV